MAAVVVSALDERVIEQNDDVAVDFFRDALGSRARKAQPYGL